ncbi:MAG: hypothetical protein N3B13_07610, partial [Deltaproteobacteria bacterium]|nr:hypothetical protein [Deltaproteobacteria bacterium]
EMCIRDRRADAHSSLARVYFIQCNFEKAWKHTETALNCNPEDAEAHYLKALLLDRQHNYELSDQHMRKANLIDPENYPKPFSVSREHFEAITNYVMQNMSENIRAFVKNIIIKVSDIPSDDEIATGISPLSLSRLVVCEKDKSDRFIVVMYSRNLLHFSQDEDELQENINICLLSEINKVLNVLESENIDAKK